MTADPAVKFCRRVLPAITPRRRVRLRRERLAVQCAVECLEPRALYDGAAAAVDPTLDAWFRADAITAAPGSALTAWPDSSGHGFTATQSNAVRAPHYAPEGLDGRPSVRFDAASLSQLSFARPVAGNFTIVVAFGSEQGIGHGDAWYGGAGLVDGEVGGVANDFGLSLNSLGQALAGTGAPDTFVASGMGFNDGRAHVATFTRDATLGTVSIYVDGKSFGSAAGGTQALTAPSRLTIGSLHTNVNYFTGDIGEIRVYSAALDGAKRGAVEAELSAAYNVAPVPANWFANPVINNNFPDPGVVYANGSYYAFATNGNGSNVQAARSTDLAHWTTLYDALPTLPSWANAGRTWAPDVAVTAAGRYNLYYTAWSRSNGRQAIGVATSSNPAGPFTPSGTAPLVAQYDMGGAIDPSVFTDAGGTQYLLWKNDGNAIGNDTNIYIQQLAANGLSLVGSPTALIYQDQPWEGSLVEAPTLWTHGGKYYLFYSANNYGDGSYAEGYAVADSLRGPYTKPAGPLAATEGDVIGPGGAEVIAGPDGNDWMLYHSWEGNFGYRSLSVDRLEWDGDEPVLRGSSRASQPVPKRPTVAGRFAFYNGSAFDGANAAANRADDAAIASDKRPLLPGATATFANVTTYTRGLNGVMIDVTRLPDTAPALDASCFDVQAGPTAGGAGRNPGPTPASVSMRRGAGANGSDRVTLTWPDGAIRNTWLRVTLRPTAANALAAADVFAFGNLVGDTGAGRAGSAAPAQVDAFDVLTVRKNLSSASPVASPYDFDRDGRVTALDLVAARSNIGRRLLSVTTAAPAPLGAAMPSAPSVAGGAAALLSESDEILLNLGFLS
jgi:GH43 family beta-xylosidase